MWATLALFAALSGAPAQATPLQLNNVRVTNGLFGPTRAEKDVKVLPGDIYLIAFDIENLTVNAEGEVKYTLGVEFINEKGKQEFSHVSEEMTAYVTLGGNRLPASAHTQVGYDTPAGKYTLKVTVTDRASKNKDKKELSSQFEVAKKGFGIVQPQLTYNQALPREIPQPPAPAVAVVGQSLVFNCLIVGFDREKEGKKEPSVNIEIRMLDDANKPTTGKPVKAAFGKGSPEGLNYFDIHWPIELNRPGKFTIELQATDTVTKKTEKLLFPLTVVEVK